MRALVPGLLVVAVVGCAAGVDRDTRIAPAAAATNVACHPSAGVHAAPVGPRDVTAGPMAFVGVRNSAGRRPDAFGRHGYKVPVTLAAGQRATLSVPPRWRGKVGLVFTQAAQRRAWEQGVRGAPRAVRFTACDDPDASARSGWPGGFVVDRPRCPTLVVRVVGQPGFERARLPLGRRCPPPERRKSANGA